MHTCALDIICIHALLLAICVGESARVTSIFEMYIASIPPAGEKYPNADTRHDQPTPTVVRTRQQFELNSFFLLTSRKEFGKDMVAKPRPRIQLDSSLSIR